MGKAAIALAFCMLAAGSAAEQIDPFRFSSNAEAQAAWKAMFGSSPVEVVNAPLAGRKGLKLPCDLTGDAQRAAWDRAVALDLTRADRFTFYFYVDDPAKLASYFSLYFQSGDGWYGATFAAGKGWNRISIDKSRFGTEGSPAGWSAVRTIRLSAWKSVETNTFVAIDDLQASSSEVVVVLGDRTPVGSGEWETVKNTAQFVAKVLQDVGVEAGGVSDTDVESGALAGRKVAVFPYNPGLTEKELTAVERFLAGGGKVIAFFGAPASLVRALGFESQGYRRQAFEGQFASIRFAAGAIEGLPKEIRQASWNIDHVTPTAKNAKVAGEWYDAKGRPTGFAAIAVSDAGAYMSHILLSDDLPGKRRLMLALLGRSMPGLWPKAAAKSIAEAPVVGEFDSLAGLKAFVSASGRTAAQAPLGKAVTLLQKAAQFARSKSYAAAMDQASAAHQAFIAAYCAAAPNKVGEMRAVWCHSASGVPGMTWDEAVKALKEAGFTAVFPNMLWGGRAHYRSALLPVDESVAKDGDRIAECVAAGRKYGVQVHVWKVNWNLLNAPKAFLEKMRAEKRTQKDPQGGDIDWLCPSNPLNFDLERDSLLEVVRNYGVDGIHFDYIRYPDERGCFCDGCRERFERQFGVKAEQWPADVVSGSLHAKYLAFRRSNITRLVKAVSQDARKIKPGIKVSAAVFSQWPQCADWVGQDWIDWVREGYVDFVCPMDYTNSASQFDGTVAAQMANVRGLKPVLPGIGVTLGEWTLTPDQVVRQILVARKRGTAGFVLFNLDRYVVDEVLPALRSGATR